MFASQFGANSALLQENDENTALKHAVNFFRNYYGKIILAAVQSESKKIKLELTFYWRIDLTSKDVILDITTYYTNICDKFQDRRFDLSVFSEAMGDKVEQCQRDPDVAAVHVTVRT